MARLSQEDGSVLLWAIGALTVGAFAVLTAASIAGVVGAQRELEAAADTAALAAANQVRLVEFNQSGEYKDLAVDLDLALTAARQALVAGGFDAQVSAIDRTNRGVELELQRQWLPGLGWGSITLRADREVALVLAG